jgi:hypothetical protein
VSNTWIQSLFGAEVLVVLVLGEHISVYGRQEKCVYVMFCTCRGLFPQSMAALAIAVFGSLALEEAREPEGRCLGVPGEPVLVIDVDYAEPLGVAHSPLEVVQE